MNAIVKDVIQNQEAVVFNALQTALEKGVDADSLEKLLDMQERVLDRQSEQAYAQSMVLVQQSMPMIDENKKNAQTNSSYADLTQIIKTITPIYTEHGFCLSFGNADSPHEGHVRVTCDVMHSGGHSKKFYTDTPLDIDGIKGNRNKTQVHGTGSAISYGQRYLTKLIFNLSTGDDDDGNSAGGDTRTVLQVDQYWFKHMEELRELIPTIHQLKENIALNELESAIEVWHELTKEEMETVWNPAPSKGGILTTQERTVMRSDEWSKKRNEINGI